MIQAEHHTQHPLVLTVEGDDGGRAGLAPTVRVRRADTPASFLDWADDTFKTSLWGLRDAPMTDLGNGHYLRTLPLDTIDGVSPGDVLLAEYHVDDGAGLIGDTSELLHVTVVRQLATNRLEETSGAPGELTLYGDDGITPVLRWELRDQTGGAVLPSSGLPARRAAGVVP